VTGSQPGVDGHIFCQFVVYTDATFTTISAVSNVTDTLVIQ
jgi:hypothetical protein